MNWISVKERLPEANQAVLFFDSDQKQIRIGFVLGIDEDITHWMPLPDPPNASNKCSNLVCNRPATQNVGEYEFCETCAVGFSDKPPKTYPTMDE